MGDENPIRTLGDYSKPSHKGYRNTIELPIGNNMVPLRSDTIRLVQNGCSFHGLWSKDPNQHLKDFLKLVDSLDIDGENRERIRMTAKLRNDILMFQQRHGESLSEAWTPFKDLLQKSLIMASIIGLKSIFFMIVSPFILSARLIAQPAANFAIRMPTNLRKSLRTSPFTTMRVGMTRKNSSSTTIPHAYADIVHSNPHPQSHNEPSKPNPFTFRERIGPIPQTQALRTTFEDRLRDYMAAHSERMERFENAIFKQHEEINDRMTEMFRLLKELTTSRGPKKVLIREEAKFPVTKNVNSISLARGEEEKSGKTDETLDNTIKPTITETEIPVMEAERSNETKNKPIKKAKRKEVEEVLSSWHVEYYLKHGINEKLIEELVDNNRFNDSLSRARVRKIKGKTYNVLPRGPIYEAILKKKITKKEDIEGNFEIPCSIGGHKHVNALVDQGSDVDVMPYSTYMKLTEERPTETDIRLSLASHSYIYLLGIAEDVLVKVAEHVYPVDFMILDIKENKKRHFILGTPFLTTAKAAIKFDKGTITLRFGKSKISFHRIPDSSCMTKKGVKNDIEPIAPTMIVNRLVLEWEEKIKLHL
ncbi:MAK10-like protein [Tanacetum coccineum]